MQASNNQKILLVVSPNFSIKMLQEEIDNIKRGGGDFAKAVDWRISAPLGVLYIAGALRKFSYDVQIYDLHGAFYLCREEGYFKEKGLSNFFEEYFDDILKTNTYDVLGISCLFNVASSTVEEMGIRCKRVSPSTKIVMGGHYPTNMYDELLNAGVCDYIILGEAEEEFLWLLDNLDDPLIDQKVSAHPHIVDQKCMASANKIPAMLQQLDNLAMPAWDLLPHVEDYIEHSLHAGRVGSSGNVKAIRSAGIISSRGCPMRCTFCAAHKVHGRTIRPHSIEYVMKHIDWLVENYDINTLLIEDDMFNFSPKRTVEFCKVLYEKYKDRFTIEFPNGLAIWRLTEEAVVYLKKVGLKSITIGVESGSAYVQKHILKKNLNLSIAKEKVELLKKYDIGVRAFYIVGLVGETLDMMNETVKFALDLNIDWSEIKIFTPLAGSELYDIAKKKGYLIGDTSEHVYGRCCMKTPEFTPEEVEDLQYDANIRVNFLNNKNLKQRKFNTAEHHFRNLLRAFPDHLFAQWGLWQALEGQRKTKESKEALKRLIDLSNKSERNRMLLRKYQIHLPRGLQNG